MSYSLSLQAATKLLLVAAATEKLNEVIAQQPVHVADKEAALSNLRTHLDLMPEAGDNDQFTVSMHGSITVVDGMVTNAGSGCNVSLGRKPQPVTP